MRPQKYKKERKGKVCRLKLEEKVRLWAEERREKEREGWGRRRKAKDGR